MKLIPRFSLRFAMIGLTIFLVAFGIWARHYHKQHRREAHQVCLTRLASAGIAVEEISGGTESDISPQLLGLAVHEIDNNIIKTLQAIPQLSNVRGIAAGNFQYAAKEPSPEPEFLKLLEQCRSLERLHLRDQGDSVQPQILRSLPNLRILDLDTTWVPVGSQEFLAQLPQLEYLRINLDGFSLDDFAKLPLSKLKQLHLTNCQSRVLRLTKQGFGRFPQLERLILEDSEFNEIQYETGAMPALVSLAIADQTHPVQLDMSLLMAVAPQLKQLALHIDQFNAEVVDAILRNASVKQIYINRGTVPAPECDWTTYQQHLIFFRPGNRELILQLSAARPQLYFCGSFREFCDAAKLAEARLDEDEFSNTQPRWKSPDWVISTLRATDSYYQPVRPQPRVKIVPVDIR